MPSWLIFTFGIWPRRFRIKWRYQHIAQEVAFTNPSRAALHFTLLYYANVYHISHFTIANNSSDICKWTWNWIWFFLWAIYFRLIVQSRIFPFWLRWSPYFIRLFMLSMTVPPPVTDSMLCCTHANQILLSTPINSLFWRYYPSLIRGISLYVKLDQYSNTTCLLGEVL